MVWYVPPLSPVRSHVEEDHAGEGADAMRIPVRYLANLFAAGDEEPVRDVLERLRSLRAFLRAERLREPFDPERFHRAGLDPQTARAIYRLLALARLEERFVIPSRPPGAGSAAAAAQGSAGFP